MNVSDQFCIGYSLNETDLRQKIQDAIHSRQEDIIEKQELQLFIDHGIDEAINKSAFISNLINSSLFLV